MRFANIPVDPNNPIGETKVLSFMDVDPRTGEHVELSPRVEPLIPCSRAPADEEERRAVLAGVAVVGTVFVSLGFGAYKLAEKVSSLLKS